MTYQIMGLALTNGTADATSVERCCNISTLMLDFNVAGSYWLNPQYAFTLSKPDKDASDGKCTFIVSLMQEIRERKRGS